MEFAQFSGAVSRVEATIPVSTVGVPCTPLFQNEELQNSQHDAQEMENAAVISDLLDEDESS